MAAAGVHQDTDRGSALLGGVTGTGSPRCLIPFDCDDFSRQALYTLLENIDEIRSDHNDELEIEGIVVNQYQSRARLPQRLVDELRAENLPVLDTYLSASVKIRESHQQALPRSIHKLPSDAIA